MDTVTGVDFSARYAVSSMPGVAFYVRGYVKEWTEESWELNCDSASCNHVDDFDNSLPECYLYNEPEEYDDMSRVRAVMVGDDHEHIVDVGELSEITEDDYCPSCGQMGCAWR